MSQESNPIKTAQDKFDKVFFAPLEKLRLKFENLELFGGQKSVTKTITVDDLMNAESELGRTIFGPIPAGHQREFFQAKKNLWIWHESWTELGEPKEITVRYEVREDGVYKKIPNRSYEKISGAELENFRKALHAYLKIIKEKLY